MAFPFNHKGEFNPHVSAAVIMVKGAENKKVFEGEDIEWVDLNVRKTEKGRAIEEKEQNNFYFSDGFFIANKSLKSLSSLGGEEKFH